MHVVLWLQSVSRKLGGADHAEVSSLCMDIVRQLATRVGNSTHVLEAVGGISARYLAGNASTERALDCFSVALAATAEVQFCVAWKGSLCLLC